MSTFLELSDVENFHNFRNKHPNNSLIGYLNITRSRNKIIDLREIVKDLGLRYFVVSETKLDKSFPAQQFVIDFEIRARKDRDQHDGGLIEYVRKGFICKRLFRT